MWNSCAKMNRLKRAFEYRGMNPKRLDLDDIGRLFLKRGITDRRQNNIVYSILSVLEPPACTMEHCKHHGGQAAFCNCGADQIPGKCKILRDFNKRQKAKAIKHADELLDELAKAFKKPDILLSLNTAWEPHTFFNIISKRKYLQHVRNWSWSMQVAVWEEIKRRVIAAKKEKEATPCQQ